MTVTRHIGFCPVCTRDLKVHDRTLVLHGYRRPGHGFIQGRCFGSHREPHELSPKCAEEWLRGVRDLRARIEDEIRTLPDATKLPAWPGSERMVTRDDQHAWRTAMESMERHLDKQQREVSAEEKRLQGLIDTWRPLPLRDVEELERQTQERRKERGLALGEKRSARAAEKAASFQKRIDWAVRRKDMAALADLWEGAKRVDALKLVDRDDIWEAFDLIDEHGEYRFDEVDHRARTYPPPLIVDRGESLALARMTGRYALDKSGNRVSLRRWPEELA